MLNCFTIRRCLSLGDTLGSCHSPGSKAPFPFLSARSGVLQQEEGKVSLSSGPHLIQWLCIDELEPKRNIRPSDPGPGATATEAELSAGCPPAKLAAGSQPAPFPALGRGRCAQPDKGSPPVPACGSTSCLPARGAFPLPPPKSPRVYRLLQDTLQPRSLSENSRGDGTRLKRLPPFWVNLGQSLSLSFLFGK